MAVSTSLPGNLWLIRDAVIELAHEDKYPPQDISKIHEWLENEGWDELVGEGSNEETVIDLRMFCKDDCELRANLGIDDAVKITDQMRVSHTRGLLEKAISGEDNYDYPTVVYYKLERSDTKSVVLCGTLNIQSGGWDITWFGVFLTPDQFLAQLKSQGIYLIQDVDAIDNNSILSFWESKPPSLV